MFDDVRYVSLNSIFEPGMFKLCTYLALFKRISCYACGCQLPKI